jgi:hypothetical protein
MTSSAKTTLQSNSDFNVLIVYDEFVSGQRAVQTYYRLMLQQGNVTDVNVKTWTFDLLKNEEINRAAIQDAAEAQLIILAAACEALPGAVENWLQGWLSHTNKRRGSFVAVLDTGEEFENDLTAVENELKAVVPGTGSEFLIEKTVPWYHPDLLCEAAYA